MNPAPGSGEPPIRTFVAVHVPPVIQEEAAGLIDQCRDKLAERSVRWARPGNIHVTLRFIGNVPPQALGAMNTALSRAVRGVRPFILKVGRLGAFPHARSPRVLWLGLDGDIEPLKALQSNVSEQTRAWGRAEGREFHPHLTLGRVATSKRAELECVAALLRDVVGSPGEPWPVDAIHLMRSKLASGGSTYSTLASFPLAG